MAKKSFDSRKRTALVIMLVILVATVVVGFYLFDKKAINQMVVTPVPSASTANWKTYKNESFQVKYPNYLSDLEFSGYRQFTSLETGPIYSSSGTLPNSRTGVYFGIDGPIQNPNNLELSKWLSQNKWDTVLPYSEPHVPTNSSNKVIDKNLVIVLSDQAMPSHVFVAWFSTKNGIFAIRYGDPSMYDRVVQYSNDFEEILLTLKFQ